MKNKMDTWNKTDSVQLIAYLNASTEWILLSEFWKEKQNKTKNKTKQNKTKQNKKTLVFKVTIFLCRQGGGGVWGWVCGCVNGECVEVTGC